MKVLFLAIGDRTIASSRARVYGYEPFLRGEGSKTLIFSFTSKAKCKRIINLEKDTPFQAAKEILHKICVLAGLLALAPCHDIIFVQKVVLPRAFFSILRRLNRNIVFDFDDAIHFHKDISHILKGASAVIVSNKTLKSFAGGFNRNVYELISPVRMNDAGRRSAESRIVIGWIGSPGTSKYLEPVLPVLGRLKEEYKNVSVALMGAAKDMGFENLKWSESGEREFLKDMDIGIMPLIDDRESREKAGYKLLLYMSSAVACVASPVGVNREIMENGVNGYLAGSPAEWQEKLSALIEDRGLRERLGVEGFRKAGALYSYDALVPKFMEILNGIHSSLQK